MSLLFVQPDWQLFANINTLPQQAGVSRHLLPRLVAKELMDNALDSGAKAEMEHLQEDLFKDVIIVRDEGAGIAGTDEEIAALFSIKRPLTSSKRLRLPSRGALGNGLRVVVATVYCNNGELTVSTRGRTLKIIPLDDGNSNFERIGTYEGKGTEIRISIPDNFFGENILEWALLTLEINQGEKYEGKTHPHWYDSDSFYSLLQTAPLDTPLVTLLVYFEKINSGKAKKIVAEFAKKFYATDTKKQFLSNELSREETDFILEELRRNVKEIPPKKLGEVGLLKGFGGYQKEFYFFELFTTKGKFNAKIPAVVEAFVKYEESSKCCFFVNKTPITGTVDLSYFDKKLTLFGCGLAHTVEIPKTGENICLWVNILTPYMPIVSNGKEPDLSVLATPICQAVKKACHHLKKKSLDENQSILQWGDGKTQSQKEAVLARLEEAIDKASGQGEYRYSLRQLYYVMRPFVMAATGKELKYANFNTIITEYEFQTGKDLAGIYRDERGTLLHPHTHTEVKLGTKNVEKYQRPIFNFNKILYSEKEGFFEILKDTGFCEKHDCALLTSKGFASRAARDVIDLLAYTEEELYFYCIHDADLSGTLIYQALQGATKARPERKVKIINLGLEPWEGLQMNLEVEKLEKRNLKTPARYVLDFDNDLNAVKPFHFPDYGRWADWQEWLRFFRIELNAMDTPTFVRWLDHKFEAFQIGKVVPDEQYLKNEANSTLEAGLKQKIREEILKKLNIEQLVSKQFEEIFPAILSELDLLDLEKDIRKTLENEPQQSWRESFLEILGKLVQKS